MAYFMKKASFMYLVFLFGCSNLSGQKTAISADKSNVLYLEMDNPITIAAENTSCKVLIVKSDNGTIEGKNGSYECRPESIGRANITVFLKQNGKLKQIGKSAFRVKYYIDESDIVFYIGNCSNDCTISKSMLQSQQYVRAQVENSDVNATFPVDSFMVQIFSNNAVKVKRNVGNEINLELKNEFESLNNGDTLVFRNIYSHRQNGTVIQLKPIRIEVSE